MKIIGACIILHNIAVSNNLINLDEFVTSDMEDVNSLNTDLSGNAYRDAYVSKYFT